MRCDFWLGSSGDWIEQCAAPFDIVKPKKWIFLELPAETPQVIEF